MISMLLIEEPIPDRFFNAEMIPISNEEKFLSAIMEHISLLAVPFDEK